MNIGVILAMLHFMKRMASSVEMQKITEKELESELASEGIGKLPEGVMVYAIEGPFFFGAVENLERALAQTHTDPHILLIRLRRVPFMDITGLQALEEAIKQLVKRGVSIMLCEANERVRSKLLKTGILKMIGEQNYFNSFAAAVNHCGTLTEDSAPYFAQLSAGK